ncbi:hypothetical protein P5P81_20785 [Tritonibacter mobilis]|nr:hypothetical protein [Tritonibacter mobilis]
MGDVLRVLANDHGQNTQKIHDFLYDVERSAVPDAIKQFLLVGADTNNALSAFGIIYDSHAPLPFGKEEIFASISAAIEARLHQGESDKILLGATQAQTQELVSRIDALAASFRLGKPKVALPFDEFNKIRLKVAKGVENANKNINVETTKGTRKVALKKVVIPARLSAISSANDLPAPHRDETPKPKRTIGLIPFRRSFNKAIILGDPGGGRQHLRSCCVLTCHIKLSLRKITRTIQNLMRVSFAYR